MKKNVWLITIFLSLFALVNTAQAENRVNPQELSERQLHLINKLYPDDDHGTMESFSWFRIKDEIIGIPTAQARKGKAYFKKQINIRIHERLQEKAKHKVMLGLLMKNGMSLEDAQLFMEAMQ